MGLGFVLLIWAVVWIVLGTIATIGLRIAARFFTRGVKEGRQKAVWVITLFPFTCIVWAGMVFGVQAVVNESLLHRDPGLGDDWHCPLPNGYALMLIDVTDEGWVFNQKTQGFDGGVTDTQGSVAGVRMVQVDGPYILGASDSRASERMGENSNQTVSYFLLDTRTGKRDNFATFDELRGVAQQRGIPLKLEPIYVVYSKYRFTWFDGLAAAFLFLPPLVALWLLVRWILHLRTTRDALPQPA
jgi:hypothetical protein